jgi:hypothetical protein
MSSLSLTVAAARQALTAVTELTTARDRDWCTTTELAQQLKTGIRDATLRLYHLEDLGLVAMTRQHRDDDRLWR